MAVDSGLWYLAEYENGDYKLNKNPKDFADVKTYLKGQGRFKHLKDSDIDVIIENRDRQWARMRKRWL
jgi:pyruvate ferredoxin oxidoreductase beta subunit